MKQKTKNVDGIQVGFDSSWITEVENAFHFSTYHAQLKYVYKLANRRDSILEIGTGNHLLYDLLKRRGWTIKSLDIDEDKDPDFCSDALDFDYTRMDINVVLAFEIFEHIPWETFQKILRKIGSANIDQIIFSVPFAEYQLTQLDIKLPRLRPVQLRLAIPRSDIQTKLHFWEVSRFPSKLDDDRRTISPAALVEAFGKAGFTLSRMGKHGRVNFFHAKNTKND